MTIPSVIAFAALALAILAHTAALFYWGGKTARLLQTHDGEIRSLREWKHEEVGQRLTEILVRLGMVESQIAGLEKTDTRLEARE